MNNTTRTLAAIVLTFTAVTLVTGGTLAAATSTAFAYQNKGTQNNGKGNNGNTNTIQLLKQNAKESGKFSIVEQNGQNEICTEPSSTCSTQGSEAGLSAFIVSNNRNLIRTLGDQWWNWALSIDATKVGNPFNDATGALCDLGIQPGNLLFLVGQREK
jgi:hypothetical protein